MFDWVGAFFDHLIACIPRFIKIRRTHRGIKWAMCGPPKELKPGIRFVWPLFDEFDVMVVARQTDDLPPQSLTLSDGTSVAVVGLVIYSVDDVVAAYGEKNWDITSTVKDLSMSAIAEVVSKLEKADLKDLRKINYRITRRVRTWTAEYGVKVERCRLVEVSVARTIRHLGVNSCVGHA
jgi:regulator of protease activity HflC (stomatin/prohibitin superfamily)